MPAVVVLSVVRYYYSRH